MAAVPIGWLSVIGPVMMFVFLRCITAVTFTERSSVKCRVKAYCNYKKTTHTYFPWIPQPDRNS
ncbi:MAG: DUF1295 domain-containing protein [Opitutales bacterium]